MKKLSSAQVKVLTKIQQRYENDLEESIKFYTEKIANYSSEDIVPVEWYEKRLEMVNNGYILWRSSNSKTLEILAEHGCIEYVKKDPNRKNPIDWVKLK